VLYCSPGVQQLLQAHVGGAAARHTSGSAGSHLASKLVSTESAPSGGTAGAAALPPPLPAGVLQAFAELQGPVVAFNLLRPDGSWVGHKEVARLAAIHHICLRTGAWGRGACGTPVRPRGANQQAPNLVSLSRVQAHPCCPGHYTHQAASATQARAHTTWACHRRSCWRTTLQATCAGTTTT
jgi:hypothetical protein